jgi:uncharacterized membrane protein
MPEFLEGAEAQLVIVLSVGAALVAVGVYVVGRVRGAATQSEPQGHELMTNFRELHSRGQLTDEEYRNIKTMLAPRLPGELKDKGDEG